MISLVLRTGLLLMEELGLLGQYWNLQYLSCSELELQHVTWDESLQQSQAKDVHETSPNQVEREELIDQSPGRKVWNEELPRGYHAFDSLEVSTEGQVEESLSQ
jgi:hypothetical protein